MDENKNLTPENGEENTNPVSEAIEKAEETFEEVKEVKEEIAETAEEIKEEAEEIIEDTKEAIEEIKEKVAPKKGKGGIIALIAALLIAAIAAALIFSFSGSDVTEGTGNLYAHGFATIKDGDVYHVNFADYKMYKTNIKSGESTLLSETDNVVYINNYKNDIYYLSYTFTEDSPETAYNYKKYVDGVNDIVLFSDVISSPQIADGYIYYLKSYEDLYSGNSSRIYRAKLEEGSTPELCCDILCISFLVDGDDLYYCEGLNTSFMKVSLSEAVKAVKENPLADGQTRASSELGAETVIASTIVASPVIIDDTLYYLDSMNQYELRKFNLKTGEDVSFNTGVFATAFNIYGKKIYYHNQSDYCIYSMNFDGSDVTKITAPNYGLTAISHDKFMSMEFAEDGTQYIGVCDLDGNKIFNITFDEQYEELFALYEEEAALEESLTEEAALEAEDTSEITEESIDTTIDMEE